ncbi:DUF2147 domain-containing protein [Bradyrhizobium sp. LVM 105]|uniref:DUF2147 domain-containing protein n=1 Tax=Bradyrhizobium sp. LVM 105 TaxID=2341115 RepID=UPI000F7FF02F|nr:DUF2147 domain-containing protein [Bradyrhizobium sp. LVM 105]RTE94580.1 DUF2147 domain-containing protein [Bradyrhizobium sp. LVM 105]
MQRLATSLGTLIALMAIAPAAEAGSYSISIGGHRFHVEAPRTCRSTSCVSISSHRGLRPVEDAATRPVPPPAPIARTSPVAPAISVCPPPATVVAPPPAAPAPTLAATTSQPVVPPQAPRPESPRAEAPDSDLPRMEHPPVPGPEIKQTAAVAQRNDDEQAHTPLGEWESRGAKGTVRIERCGPALCGYALTEASNRGESVLVNMKPKSHEVWTGSIYSRSSGNTYYATMTLKRSGRLHVEACALWRFWCSGNDWTRVEAPREQLITTSRQWSARS